MSSQRTPTFDAICVTSPAEVEGEDKDQDRIHWDGNQLFACVCDGLTSSPFSDQAALYLSEHIAPALLGSTEELSRSSILAARDHLIKLRQECLMRPVQLSAETPLVLSELLSEATHVHRKLSYQSTVAALRISYDEAVDQCIARALWCGDTGIYAFTSNGEIAWTNLALQESGLTAHSSKTFCFPDDAERTEVIYFVLNKQGAEIQDERRPNMETEFLLASDGFYMAFDNIRNVWKWLHSNLNILGNKPPRLEQVSLMQELHQKLRRTVGDDDISFVFVRPRVLTA